MSRRREAVWGCALVLMGAHARRAEAVCGGASPTWTAASALPGDVADCVAAAASGDTIQVPAGTETWADALALPGDKDLELIGAGIDVTSLACASGWCFSIDLEATHRISGFTMTGDGSAITTTGDQDLAKHFRIDHNRIVSTSGWVGMELSGGANGVHPQGIVDNNQFRDVAVHANGTRFQLDEGDQQHVLWSQPTPLGDSTQVVYIEDNAFEGSDANINWADSNYGGRYVFRFNRGTGRGYVEVHSVQGANRASQRFEIYENSFTAPLGFSLLAFIRGGSGVAFGNRLSADHENDVLLDNVRSEEDPGGGVGQCDGTSPWDENLGQDGYACRDQIGRAHDSVQWDHAPPAAYAQVLQPVYFWDNQRGGAPFQVDNSGLDTWILENRDFYLAAAGFDGTAGVGEGPVAERPATCTPGVAYWATDEGDWDATQAGPDGQLYRCTAAGTWALVYTPYPYPHPWQGTGTQPPPDGGPNPGADGGTNPGTGGGDSGCDCRISRGPRAGAAAILLFGAVGLATLRRRRRG